MTVDERTRPLAQAVVIPQRLPDYAPAVNVDRLLAVQRSSYATATPGLSSAWPEEQALDRDGLAALLDRHRYCVLATSRADGRAHAAPVAFPRSRRCLLVRDRVRSEAPKPRGASMGFPCGHGGSRPLGRPRRRSHVALTAEGPITLHAIDDWRSIENGLASPSRTSSDLGLSPGRPPPDAPVQLRRQLGKTTLQASFRKTGAVLDHLRTVAQRAVIYPGRWRSRFRGWASLLTVT